MRNIGSRLKQIRQMFNLTQPAFAKAIGVSSGNVSDWENGRSNPGAQALIAISNQFKISTDWLLKGGALGPAEPLPHSASQLALSPNEQKIHQMLQGLDDQTLSLVSDLIRMILAREALTSMLEFDDEEMLQISKYILFLKQGEYQTMLPHRSEN